MSAKQAWSKRQEIPDPQVRDAAVQFELARQLLWAQPVGFGLLYPLINTAAVAIELYLKCLSAEKVYGELETGWAKVWAKPSRFDHRLIDLLERVDGDLQKELDHSFRAELSAFDGLSFRDALSRFEGAFEDSRYPYEQHRDLPKYPLDLLMAYSKFLGQFVAKLQTREHVVKPTD